MMLAMPENLLYCDTYIYPFITIVTDITQLITQFTHKKQLSTQFSKTKREINQKSRITEMKIRLY